MRQLILENYVVKNGLIKLTGKDYKYLRQVLRAKVGDMIEVRLKDQTLWGSTLVSIDDKTKCITLQLCNEINSESSVTRGVKASELQNENSCDYYLFQFIPKPQKFEMIVRQATECGVKKIIPVIGEYSDKSSVKALQSSKQERLERIIKEARQQSGSPVDSQVLEPLTIEDSIAFWKEVSEGKENLAIVLSERNDFSESLRTCLDKKENIKCVGLAVGSEGGISPQEIEILRKNGLFHAIHFDVNILRCETAALYGMAAIQTAISDKS